MYSLFSHDLRVYLDLAVENGWDCVVQTIWVNHSTGWTCWRADAISIGELTSVSFTSHVSGQRGYVNPSKAARHHQTSWHVSSSNKKLTNSIDSKCVKYEPGLCMGSVKWHIVYGLAAVRLTAETFSPFIFSTAAWDWLTWRDAWGFASWWAPPCSPLAQKPITAPLLKKGCLTWLSLRIA